MNFNKFRESGVICWPAVWPHSDKTQNYHSNDRAIFENENTFIAIMIALATNN